MTYDEAVAYLLRLPSFSAIGSAAYVPGLARIAALLDGMGAPHSGLRVAHVAGTNGKGSTASMLASIATSLGRRVGLHTSPHLYRVNERMRIDGVPIPDARLAALVARYAPLIDRVAPSFFEATVALSLCYFSEASVDLAVVEVGLGGRLDATNIVAPSVSVVTSIGLDHTALLGDTVEAIAAEKAGIVKQGVPVICGADQPSVVAVVRGVASRVGAPLHVLDDEVETTVSAATVMGTECDIATPLRTYAGVRIALPGRFQPRNASMAVRAAELLFTPHLAESGAGVYRGLRAVREQAGLSGRLEVMAQEPLVVRDVGHNLDGLSAGLSFMNEWIGKGGRLFVIFGVMNDKDVDGMARLLSDAGAKVHLIPAGVERALSPPELAALLARYGISVTSSGSLPDAMQWFNRQSTPLDGLLITGSHHIASQVPSLS